MSDKLVIVKWRDSCSVAGWQFRDAYSPTEGCGTECTSVGFVLSDTKAGLEIAQSTSPDQYGDILILPRFCITDIQELDYDT